MDDNAKKVSGLSESAVFLGLLRVMAHVRDWTLSVMITMVVGFGIWAFWTSALLPFPFWNSFQFIAFQWLGIFPLWFVQSVWIMILLAGLVLAVVVGGWLMGLLAAGLNRAGRWAFGNNWEVFRGWLNNPLSMNTRVGWFAVLLGGWIASGVIWYFDFEWLTQALVFLGTLVILMGVYVVMIVQEALVLRRVYVMAARGDVELVPGENGRVKLKLKDVHEGHERVVMGLDP